MSLNLLAARRGECIPIIFSNFPYVVLDDRKIVIPYYLYILLIPLSKYIHVYHRSVISPQNSIMVHKTSYPDVRQRSGKARS